MTDTEMRRREAICKAAGVSEIDDLSDGFHTFRQLYYQRMILFAAIVRQNKDKAWKSFRHEDGELCFGGGWFIVGVDTPEGSYTYHYEAIYFGMFDCEELERGKCWDGHTEKDVTRLLSLPSIQPDTTTHGSNVVKKGGNDEDRTTDDLISRQQAIDALRDYLAEKRCPNDGTLTCRLIENKVINKLPPVQPERKTGRWIESNPQDSKVCRLMTCSECGKAYIVNINVPYEDWTEAHKFCVECGTDMRGEQNG